MADKDLAIKRLLEPCKPWLTVPCPTLGLVATVSQKEIVDVWRLNGQHVFGIAPDDTHNENVHDVQWKTDGRLLAVAFSSGTIVLVSTFTGKTVNRFRSPRTQEILPDLAITSNDTGIFSRHSKYINIFWSLHRSRKIHSHGYWPQRAVENLGPYDATHDLAADLPSALVDLDVEQSLPKLCSLPSTGPDDDLFSTRTAVDSIFHPNISVTGHNESSSKEISILLSQVGRSGVQIHIFDSFEIGTIELQSELPKSMKIRRIIDHAGHRQLSDQYLVVEVTDDGLDGPTSEVDSHSSLHVVQMDLKFLRQSQDHLPLLCSKATQLQNLLRYLEQAQRQLTAEVRTAFDLPSRFLNNLETTLKEHDINASFGAAAYHLIVTGECSPHLKEWLVDDVGERGLKRWEKAVGDCLRMLQRLISECLIPVIERCQVVLSRLGGLALFDNTATRLGLDGQKVRAVRETLDELNIVCEHCLGDVCLELKEFSAFIRWLRWEAEVEGLDEDSERAEEIREAFSGENELRLVLDYIDGPLFGSRVLNHVETQAQPEHTSSECREPDGNNIDFSKAFKNACSDDREPARKPKLGALIGRLSQTMAGLFSGVAGTLKESVRVSHVTKLPSSNRYLDCRMVETMNVAGTFELNILTVNGRDAMGVTKSTVSLQDHGPDAKNDPSSILLSLKDVSEIHDSRFIGDDDVIVLASVGGDRQVLSLDLRDVTSGQNPTMNWRVRRTFAQGDMSGGMVAGSLAVSTSGRDRYIVVSDAGRMGYTVHQLKAAD